jgi:hypothetical protein
MTIDQFCEKRGIDRRELEIALETARLAQSEFWDALAQLECLLGAEVSLDNADLEETTLEDLVDSACEEEAAA